MECGARQARCVPLPGIPHIPTLMEVQGVQVQASLSVLRRTMLPEHEEQQDFGRESSGIIEVRATRTVLELQIQVSLEFPRMGPDGL